MSGTTGEPVTVLASRVRADEKRLFEALERRGVPYRHRDTAELWHLASATDPGGLVLNREISFSRCLYAARTLEAAGRRVLNSAAATEVCGDKWLTTMALTRARVPTPRTALALTPEAAPAALAEIGYPAVIKPLVGSWGRLVAPIPDPEVAATVLEYVAALPGAGSHLVYVQQMVEKPGRDIRVAVVGGEVIGASYRRSEQWRTNVARGGETSWCEPVPAITGPALAAAAAVGADVCGVDLVEDTDGRPLVLEVNHGLEFSGLQRALGDRVDVAGRVADLVVARAAA